MGRGCVRARRRRERRREKGTAGDAEDRAERNQNPHRTQRTEQRTGHQRTRNFATLARLMAEAALWRGATTIEPTGDAVTLGLGWMVHA